MSEVVVRRFYSTSTWGYCTPSVTCRDMSLQHQCWRAALWDQVQSFCYNHVYKENQKTNRRATKYCHSTMTPNSWHCSDSRGLDTVIQCCSELTEPLCSTIPNSPTFPKWKGTENTCSLEIASFFLVSGAWCPPKLLCEPGLLRNCLLISEVPPSFPALSAPSEREV